MGAINTCVQYQLAIWNLVESLESFDKCLIILSEAGHWVYLQKHLTDDLLHCQCHLKGFRALDLPL